MQAVNCGLFSHWMSSGCGICWEVIIVKSYLLFIRYINTAITWAAVSTFELLFAQLLRTMLLQYTGTGCWQEANSGGLKVMRSPECESSFICLFGHICWASGFHIITQLTSTEYPDRPDRDHPHPWHSGPGRVQRSHRWEKSWSGKNHRFT